MLPRVIIVTGPTASGKTDLSETLAQRCNGSIINADMGQFYTPLTIGTAKPDWKNKLFDCLLFDILDQPVELNIVKYRAMVLQAVSTIIAQGKVPIIVGGSLFYIKSLFFPPLPQQKTEHFSDVDFTRSTYALWSLLNTIDVDRAKQIHHNDRYRIVRALTIWQQTGVKPSKQQPVFAPAFNTLVISLEPARDVLKKRIEMRTCIMLQQGLIDEARTLVNTDWEAFLEKKGLIGYHELFAWIRAVQHESLLDATAGVIVQKTWQYAKRQLTFLSKFKNELAVAGQQAPGLIRVLTLSQCTTTPELINSIKIFLLG